MKGARYTSDGLTTKVAQEKSVAAPQYYFWLMLSQEEKSGYRVFDP